MTVRRPSRAVVPGDVAMLLVGFGIVPLVLSFLSPADPERMGRAPWSFALVASWSVAQLGAVLVAGGVLGWITNRGAHGLAAVATGVCLGLGADLWWFAGWAERGVVSTLPQEEWRARMTVAALALVGAVSAGYAIAAAARRLARRLPVVGDATASGLLAIAVALVGAPLAAVAVAATAASSPLVVQPGTQVQAVRVSSAAIEAQPVDLQVGPTRVLCEFAPDAAAEWALLVPYGLDLETLSESADAIVLSCSPAPGEAAWASGAELQPGRYAWLLVEIDDRTGEFDPIATSPPVVVTP